MIIGVRGDVVVKIRNLRVLAQLLAWTQTFEVAHPDVRMAGIT